MYFDGLDDFMEVVGITVAPTHTVQMWIRPALDGVLWSINRDQNANAGDEDLLTLLYEAQNIRLTIRDELDSSIRAEIESSGDFVTLNDWHQLAYTITWQQDNYQSSFELYINNINQGLAGTHNGWIYDRASYTHLLGAEQNSNAGSPLKANFYSGMIWSFCYWPQEIKIFDVLGACEKPGPRCRNCPGHGEWECIIDCEWNEWLDGEVCQSCDDSCAEGCIRAENCQPCFDDTCGNCPMWTDCELCIDNADKVGEDCECNIEYFYIEEEDRCASCDSACQQCTNDTIWECQECKDTFFQHRDAELCTSHCPTGFTEDGSNNTCSGDPQLVFCLTFDKQQLDWVADNGVTIRSGHNSGTVREADDPIPIYKRGMWFDGEDDCMEINDFSLNPTFTLEAWVRIAPNPEPTTNEEED